MEGWKHLIGLWNFEPAHGPHGPPAFPWMATPPASVEGLYSGAQAREAQVLLGICGDMGAGLAARVGALQISWPGPAELLR